MTHRAPVIYNRTHGSHGAEYCSPIAQVICRHGDIKALAAELGCAKQLVHHWLVGLKRPSERFALAIEQLTGLPKQSMRPDIWRSDGRRRPKRSKS